MNKFKVGDKVIVRSWDDMEKEYGLDGCGSIDLGFGFVEEMREFCGKVVTIKAVFDEGYAIKEDYEIYLWNDDMFVSEYRANDMIVVYADIESRKVVAIDKSTGEKAEAYCHPDDEFDFKIGASYVFDRLRGREERVKNPHEGYNGEVILTKKNIILGDSFTVGKIYKVKNGVIANDYGGLLNFKKKFFNIGFAEVKR